MVWDVRYLRNLVERPPAPPRAVREEAHGRQIRRGHEPRVAAAPPARVHRGTPRGRQHRCGRGDGTLHRDVSLSFAELAKRHKLSKHFESQSAQRHKLPEERTFIKDL